MTNKIQFVDFHPEVLEKSFWTGKKYQEISEVMIRVNDWVQKNYNREIINIETIQNLDGNMQKQSSSSTSSFNAGGGYVYMVQTIRVWYR